MDKVETKDYELIRKQVEAKVANRGDIINRRGRKVVPRKYHMTELQVEASKTRFIKDTSTVSADIKSEAGDRFFNPYRKAGIFYGQVQSLYELGANKWHSCMTVINKVEEVTSKIIDTKNKSTWVKFSRKGPRMNDGIISINAKDIKGRIHNNFRLMQRLKGVHPYGEKLRQAYSCIDIKQTERGIWYYRLTTVEFEAPIYDTSKCLVRPKRGRKKRTEVEALKEGEVEALKVDALNLGK